MASQSLRNGPWPRRARIAAIVVVIGLILFGLVGYFVAPGIVRSVAEKKLSEQLGRKTTIGSVKLNPYALSATIEDFKLYEADGTGIAVQIAMLHADVSSASLFKRALVLDELRISQPVLRVARLEAQRFSFSDIVDRLASQPKSDSTFLFSVNNIQLDGGVIDVDDRLLGREHHVDGIRIALPFLSNLPYDTTVFVKPEFAAVVDGSAIALTGNAQPFASSREAAVELNVTDLDLTEYMDLSPTKLAFRLASGKLSAKLALTFRATTTDADGKTVPQSLSIAGHVGVAGLDVTDLGKRSAIRAKAIDVDIAKLDPFSGDVALQRVAMTEPQVDATRRADGSIDLLDLFKLPATTATTATPAPTTTAATPTAATPTTPPTARPEPVFTIAAVRVDKAAVRFVDQTLRTPVTTQLKDVDLEAGAVALKGATPTTYKLALMIDDGTRLDVQGSVVVSRREANGDVTLKGFRPARIAPYLASVLAARIDDGSIDASAHFQVDASGPALQGVVDRIAVQVDRLKTSLPDEKAALLGAERLALEGGSFDLGKRSFTADALKLTAPVIAVKRDAKGRLNLQAALVQGPPAAPGAAVEVEPADARPFTAVLKSLAIERGDLAFEDLAVSTPTRIRAQPFNLVAENLGTAANAVIPFDLSTGIDRRGKLAIKGKVALSPMNVEASIDASQVPVGWLAAYAGERLNIVVESADLDTKGALRLAQPKTGAMTVAYKGSLGVLRMRALDKATSEEFLQWKSLAIPQVDFQMPAKNAPLAVRLGVVTVDDFYARIIVNTTGRLNLQDVIATPGERQSVTTPEAAPKAAQPATPAAAGPPASIHVAGVKLGNGRVGITDNFIKPNYSANLTGLAGDVSAIASDAAEPASIKLDGRIDGDGVLAVSGLMNPLAFTTFTDIAAEAKDIELTRLSPYAIKYAGYAIERGKLSMTVKYHIENGKLDASNRLFLDQLTFGPKVESATATRLPVLLAVALLKNSRGEIDINLPISGSLSDPEFSVGSVIVRVLVNLITRAVTSPFSLIASAAGIGGGGTAGELGYVQFQPGVSDLAPQGKTKLETLAKALADRPALKLDIIGRYDPVTDPEGIKRDHLLDQLKDLKAKDLSKSGDRVGRNDVTIEPAEYATYLARVYDDTKLPDKPRNVIGLSKAVPVEAMEQLLLANMKLDENDPRWLAEARADVVRHYIEDTGKVSPSRVFLVTPKLNADGIDDKGVPNRVDFTLR